jgi:hypothetical protein
MRYMHVPLPDCSSKAQKYEEGKKEERKQIRQEGTADKIRF